MEQQATAHHCFGFQKICYTPLPRHCSGQRAQGSLDMQMRASPALIHTCSEQHNVWCRLSIPQSAPRFWHAMMKPLQHHYAHVNCWQTVAQTSTKNMMPIPVITLGCSMLCIVIDSNGSNWQQASFTPAVGNVKQAPGSCVLPL